jgi:hypothetical protein
VDLKTVGESALVGWRGKVGEGLARPVSDRTGFDADQVRAAVGLLFFVLSLVYVVTTVARILRER